jgi:hypothetical protein
MGAMDNILVLGEGDYATGLGVVVARVVLSVWTLDVRRQVWNRYSMFVIERTLEVRMVMRRIVGTAITILVFQAM